MEAECEGLAGHSPGYEHPGTGKAGSGEELQPPHGVTAAGTKKSPDGKVGAAMKRMEKLLLDSKKLL